MCKVRFEDNQVTRGKFRYPIGDEVFVKFRSGDKNYWTHGKIVAIYPSNLENLPLLRAFPFMDLGLEDAELRLVEGNMIYIMHREPEGYDDSTLEKIRSGELVCADDPSDWKYTDAAKALSLPDEGDEENEDDDFEDEDDDFDDEDEDDW
uniref:hypothetical protein n=1 Tax=Lachnoclostridium phocaeense TaxID=1871021 RepID=UPI0026DC27F0|nr:hypothetical protein [Lachnoclostridium phocaeense]